MSAQDELIAEMRVALRDAHRSGVGACKCRYCVNAFTVETAERKDREAKQREFSEKEDAYYRETSLQIAVAATRSNLPAEETVKYAETVAKGLVCAWKTRLMEAAKVRDRAIAPKRK